MEDVPMPNARDTDAELEIITNTFERFVGFMAVIAGQGTLDALDFVCEETTRDIVRSNIPEASTDRIIAELSKTRAIAKQSLAAAQRH
jgi:hypothetical protein